MGAPSSSSTRMVMVMVGGLTCTLEPNWTAPSLPLPFVWLGAGGGASRCYPGADSRDALVWLAAPAGRRSGRSHRLAGVCLAQLAATSCPYS